ncbi:hypothetical protein CA234_09850 [Sphingomonas sp. ABOLE]|uniref:hypothetical protein n=1 Tax=Sphingomonas sp. ABOLE TaxID=1985878 RepID=UPI000F7D71E5|nr:hypothetical protein [Sphingomonas sp. ABOLE]RSV41105.1 hypothetical protein CA234_09850 [Sphingomonas sp. ABOLE]
MRFEREDIDLDPMEWMTKPLGLFGGKAPIEACLERDAFLQALMLHGLSLGLDACPEGMSGLRLKRASDPNASPASKAGSLRKRSADRPKTQVPA